MRTHSYFIACSLLGLVLLCITSQSSRVIQAQSEAFRFEPYIARDIPGTGNHPGNVYVLGETLRIAMPLSNSQDIDHWRVLNDEGEIVKTERIEGAANEDVNLGALGVGWYRIEFLDDDGNCLHWTTAAVLRKLKAPVPQGSPICIDGAHSWFAEDDPTQQKQLSRLAALCGVNWIRDRLRWRDIQPGDGPFGPRTTYDECAGIQASFGLKILQVFHGVPKWVAGEDESTGRFPGDLRHVYRFCASLAKRFQTNVQAWEPWNEANAGNFGGHTVDEMCSLQKAAYLGFKNADSNVIVGWNAYAGKPTWLHTRGVLNNEAWPYFDTYNIHTYDWPHSYSELRRPAVEAAAGRPLWITESDRGVQYQSGSPWFDMTPENEILKAQFMAQSYASSLYAGAERHFHFILGDYTEEANKVQFGLLRKDLTPRPAYVAMAALGRLMAGAKCLGRFHIRDNEDTHVYAFLAQPDGVKRDVLVAWTETRSDWPQRGKHFIEWPLPENLNIIETYDYLGRKRNAVAPEMLTSSPLFVILPQGESKKLQLETYPRANFREGEASPVVMQLLLDSSCSVRVEETPWAVEYEHLVEPEKELELPLYIYNFSDQPVSGEVKIEHAPGDWKLSNSSWQVQLNSMDRQRLPLTVVIPKRDFSKKTDTWLRLKGRFDGGMESVLAFRLITQPGEGYEN
ncbi:MAG: hypothetical protein P9L94_01495 [Candidatus Hinthialibacter antarcticus]|nr:hypothetical protein [Candidatus Hinthialibacter antarcticus]